MLLVGDAILSLTNCSQCVMCGQMKMSFNAPTPHLQALPIMGFGYQWKLDFVGPLSLILQHN
jgi:hypothetical protein